MSTDGSCIRHTCYTPRQGQAQRGLHTLSQGKTRRLHAVRVSSRGAPRDGYCRSVPTGATSDQTHEGWRRGTLQNVETGSRGSPPSKEAAEVSVGPSCPHPGALRCDLAVSFETFWAQRMSQLETEHRATSRKFPTATVYFLT